MTWLRRNISDRPKFDTSTAIHYSIALALLLIYRTHKRQILGTLFFYRVWPCSHASALCVALSASHCFPNDNCYVVLSLRCAVCELTRLFDLSVHTALHFYLFCLSIYVCMRLMLYDTPAACMLYDCDHHVRLHVENGVCGPTLCAIVNE